MHSGRVVMIWDTLTQDSYKKVIITDNELNTIVSFETGDPIIDWLDCLIYMSDFKESETYIIDSSFDDFFNVLPPYQWNCMYILGNEVSELSTGYHYRVISNDNIKSLSELVSYYKKKKRTDKLNAIFN